MLAPSCTALAGKRHCSGLTVSAARGTRFVLTASGGNRHSLSCLLPSAGNKGTQFSATAVDRIRERFVLTASAGKRRPPLVYHAERPRDPLRVDCMAGKRRPPLVYCAERPRDRFVLT